MRQRLERNEDAYMAQEAPGLHQAAVTGFNAESFKN
jgi:hypothetical protein